MGRSVSLLLIFLMIQAAHPAPGQAELVRGGAALSTVSSVIKISREGNGLDSLVEGEVLYIFTEKGEPVAQVIIKDVFSDAIYSEPLPGAVARQIRETNSILIFSNLREYGDFLAAYLEGSEDAFRNFIQRFPRSELGEEAQRIVDGLVYRPYKLRGTPEAMEEFAQKYPDNSYVRNALTRRDDLLFEPVRNTDRISAYRSFLISHPDNRHAGEARERLIALQGTFEESTLEEVARYPRAHLGRKVRFPCQLHSTLPIYVEGPGVGRKTASFSSPRNAAEHINLQVEEKELVLWRLFVPREDEDLARRLQEVKKGEGIMVYGVVFDILGGAPWIDVVDMEKI